METNCLDHCRCVKILFNPSYYIQLVRIDHVYLSRALCRELSLDMYNFYDGGEGVREDGEDEIEVGGFDQIQEGDVNVYFSRW